MSRRPTGSEDLRSDDGIMSGQTLRGHRAAAPGFGGGYKALAMSCGGGGGGILSRLKICFVNTNLHAAWCKLGLV